MVDSGVGREPSLEQLVQQVRNLATAVTDGGQGKDATGGHVECLTEAVMGVTAGLCRIADAISDLASAVREGQ